MLHDIVAILQVGFAGFAFLMAGLSFRLMQAEAKRDGAPRLALLRAISRYTNYTLLLAIVVCASRFGESWFDSALRRQETEQELASQEAKTCRDGLDRLINASVKVSTDYQSLLSSVQQDVAGCRSIVERIAAPRHSKP